MRYCSGTSHFVSISAARAYYKQYGCDKEMVSEKLANGEISIGAPRVKKGQYVILIDGGRRYGIVQEACP